MSTAFEFPEWLVQAPPPSTPSVDDHRVEALVNRFIAGKQDALFTAPDAFYRLAGADAVEGRPAITDRLHALRAATLDLARDDGERAALEPRLDLHLDDAMGGIDRHVAEQRRVYRRQVVSERQALIERAAELEHDNDDKVAGLAEANATAAGERARLDGISSDSPEAAAAVLGARSSILRTAINQRIANGKGAQALALFDRVKDQLAPADRLALDTPVQVARNDQVAGQWIARESKTEGPPLLQRLDADSNLPPEAKAIVRAKAEARESANQSARSAKVQALDDEVHDASRLQIFNPNAYRPGTFARLADAYAAVGERERAAFARRLAAQDAFIVPFAQAGAERQQRMIDELPAGELRDTAIVIKDGQAQSFAHDAFAAGTTIYTEVGRPVPIDDIQGRIHQARQIAQLRGGAPVVPFTLREIDDMRRTLAAGPEQAKQAVRARLAAVPVEMQPAIEPRGGDAPPDRSATSTFRIDAVPGMPPRSIDGAADGSAPAAAGGRTGSPTTEPPPGSQEYQAADAEGRRILAQREADRRVTDRFISAWIASTDGDTQAEIPPAIAKRLEPDQRAELEKILEDSADAETDPAVLAKITRGLTNYNSQVRLKWAREPLYRFRPRLSPEDFAKVAALQDRLEPHTGSVLGSAPIPADLQPLYDALAPDPGSEYSTVRATDEHGRHRLAMPMAARSFLKGLLDLFAAQKTGELTMDSLASFAALNGLGGTIFGPRGGPGTLAAGGRRIELSLAKRVRANYKAGREYEEQFAQHLRDLGYLDVAVQITVKLPSGVKLRLDVIARNRRGKLYIYEAKAGKGRLRRLQGDKLKALEKEGGTIVGAGKEKFEGGMRIPPGLKFKLQREGEPFDRPLPWARPPSR
jgi:hypothetical protein